MRQSDDQTLFAWHLGTAVTGLCGPLATSPAQFSGCKNLLPVPDMFVSDVSTSVPYSMTNKGLRINLPLVEYDDTVVATAILQCSTMSIYPTNITLPLVRVSQQGTNYFARNPNFTGPLPSVDVLLTANAIRKTIFIRQEPEQNMHRGDDLLVHIQGRLMDDFQPLYLDPRLIPMAPDVYGKRRYLFPSRCRDGTMIFASGSVRVVVLFNKRERHYGCKVMIIHLLLSARSYGTPMSQMNIHANILPLLDSTHHDDVKSSNPIVMAKTIQNSRSLATTLEKPLVDLHHALKLVPTSLCYVDNGAVYANIALQNILGQNEVVLDVKFLHESEEQWPICELPSGKLFDDYWYPSRPVSECDTSSPSSGSCSLVEDIRPKSASIACVSTHSTPSNSSKHREE
jgi:hypothetical protein